MTTAVDHIVERVASLLQDTMHVRWTLPDLTDYINEAQVAIVKKVPAANITIANLTLVQGIKQAVPADAMVLMDVIRNNPGGSPGIAVRWVDMDIQNATDPNWANATAAVTVEEYMYETDDPYTFWVSPPQTSSPTDVQIKYAATPPIINIGENITIGDEFVNAIIEYIDTSEEESALICIDKNDIGISIRTSIQGLIQTFFVF